PPVEDPCAAAYSDNLALIEKYTYGQGEGDADQVVELRRYDQKVTNQYRLEGCDNIPSNDEDQIGHVERYGYDWRMRRIWVEVWSSNQASAPTRIVATWFDNLDRVRFTAVFDPVIKAPSSNWPGDPRLAPTNGVVPAASQLVGLGALSLTETVYDSRGNVAELRHYDCGGGANAGIYTAVRTWYDDLGREREREDPGVGTRRTVFDAAGRETCRSLVVNGAEVSVDSVQFDAADNPIETTQMLRRHDGVGAVLGSGNAVIMQRFEWFDGAGRQIASAAIGTNHAGDLFANGPRLTRPEAPTYSNGLVQRPVGLARAMVEIWGYDQYGRESLHVDVSGAATRTAFDERDRKVAVCENADGGTTRRTTAYRYDSLGRVSHVGASVRDLAFGQAFAWDASDGSVQVTAIDYDGPMIAASTGAPIEGGLSGPDFVSRVRYPSPSTGQPDSQRAVSFGYRLDTRQVAMRIEATSQLRYGYDERGNLTRIDAIGGALPGSPAAPITPVATIINAFDALDRLVGCSTWGVQDGSLRAMNQIAFEYDGRGNLIGEQAIRSGPHGLGVSDWTRYEWDVAGGGGGNRDRLSTLVYPVRRGGLSGGGVATRVGLRYGTSGSIDDGLSRIRMLVDETAGVGGGGTGRAYGSWQFAGLDTVIGEQRCVEATGIAASSWSPFAKGDQSGTYASLDRFGRMRNQQWVDAQGRSQYGRLERIDPLGRLIGIEETRAWNSAKQSTIAGRSWGFGYDGLGRLTSLQYGALASSGAIVDLPSMTAVRNAWNLDVAGNWAGTANLWGRVTTGPPAGANTGQGPVQRLIQRLGAGAAGAGNGANQIRELLEQQGTQPARVDVCSYDPRGNLTSDGTYAYQCDALQRLIGVRLLGGASVDASGRLVHPELLGCWVRAYEYDGLGRLVTVLSPQLVDTGTSAPVRRVEQYLHDGEQRIAEVVAESAGQWAAATQCEYVWDPHAADRLICQLDATRRPWIVLSNRVGTPTAVVDGQTGLVAEQYAIGPFGACESLEVLGSTQPAAGQVLKVGYQGLFTDRLDAILGKPVLVPGARTLVHNRARVYMPRLGRFLQQDPNRAGIALPGAGVAALPSFGMPPAALAVDVDPLRQYGDGTNLYAAVGGNPIGQRDPKGLFFSLGEVNFSASTAADLDGDWA
ncbi:MAG: hypothetical protein NTV94_07500, partial [Planctomycetota bacterium]|nr:hypothetical protein [Planctomycetota bacterium]